MTRLWQTASVVTALGTIAVGAASMTLTSSPAQAVETAVPADVATPAGCMENRIQVPTISGLQWNKLIVCMDSR